MMPLDCFRFKCISEEVESLAFEQGTCIDLNLKLACFDAGIVKMEHLIGDYFVNLNELQSVIDSYCEFDAMNY